MTYMSILYFLQTYVPTLLEGISWRVICMHTFAYAYKDNVAGKCPLVYKVKDIVYFSASQRSLFTVSRLLSHK